jgi:DNA-binding HxlR family transcriptional regulator
MSPTRRAGSRTDTFLRYPGSALVISLLADKWTIPVIHTLARGTHRTGELRRAVAGVSQKMLTQTLRALEERGLIERTVFPVVPPRVEYRLTALGESINEPLQHLCEWTAEHGRALERAVVRVGRAKREPASQT